MNDLSRLLALEATEGDRFRAANGRGGWVSLYGGQVLAQALAAATRTVDADRLAHSLHAYFLRAGAFEVPIMLDVERDRDGRGFSSRRVSARQEGAAILTLMASFQVKEDGPVHDLNPMPHVPSPEDLPAVAGASVGKGGGAFDFNPVQAVEIRPVDSDFPFAKADAAPRSMAWMRMPTFPDADPAMQRILLTYMSDLFLLNAALRPHRSKLGAGAQLASLDHAIWFLGEPRVADWMLYVQESPWAGGGRALCRGIIYNRDGQPIASIVQEALMRMGTPREGETR